MILYLMSYYFSMILAHFNIVVICSNSYHFTLVYETLFAVTSSVASQKTETSMGKAVCVPKTAVRCEGTLLTSVFGQLYHLCLSHLPRTTHELSTSSVSCRSPRRESSKHRRYIRSTDIATQTSLTKKKKKYYKIVLFICLL